jgi:hypothetical protein
LLKANPSLPEDGPMLDKLASISLVPGGDFDMFKTSPEIEKGRARCVKAGQDPLSQPVNGRNMAVSLESCGMFYGGRACIGLIGLGANLSADARLTPGRPSTAAALR